MLLFSKEWPPKDAAIKTKVRLSTDQVSQTWSAPKQRSYNMDINHTSLDKQEILTDALLSMKRAQELEDLFIEPLPDGFHFVNDKLMYQEPTEEGKDPKPGIFVCSRLDIIALTRDSEGNNQGRLLEFIDADGIKKRWAMPMELLAGDGCQYRADSSLWGSELEQPRVQKHCLPCTFSLHCQKQEPFASEPLDGITNVLSCQTKLLASQAESG